MTAAYFSYCDAETEAGRGGVCAKCGNHRTRGDRMVIDDPHATMTDGEIAAASQRFRAFLDNHPVRDVKPVIIIARMHGPEAE